MHLCPVDGRSLSDYDSFQLTLEESEESTAEKLDASDYSIELQGDAWVVTNESDEDWSGAIFFVAPTDGNRQLALDDSKYLGFVSLTVDAAPAGEAVEADATTQDASSSPAGYSVARAYAYH